VVHQVKVIVDTAFNGTPGLSIGIDGTASKYFRATQVDLTQPAGTAFEVDPAVNAVGITEALIATYAAGAATVGSARLLVEYSVPS
jgi:hypothetical protein